VIVNTLVRIAWETIVPYEDYLDSERFISVELGIKGTLRSLAVADFPDFPVDIHRT
jgi:hypothetical protein